LLFVKFPHDGGGLFEDCAIALGKIRKDFLPLFEIDIVGQFRRKQASFSEGNSEWNLESTRNGRDGFGVWRVSAALDFIDGCSADSRITGKVCLRPIPLDALFLHPFTEVFSAGHGSHFVIRCVSFA
jgi:hypothetical protein